MNPKPRSETSFLMVPWGMLPAPSNEDASALAHRTRRLSSREDPLRATSDATDGQAAIATGEERPCRSQRLQEGVATQEAIEVGGSIDFIPLAVLRMLSYQTKRQWST